MTLEVETFFRSDIYVKSQVAMFDSVLNIIIFNKYIITVLKI